MSSSHASLDAAATERKARLAKLASLKRKQPPAEDDEAVLKADHTLQTYAKDSETKKYLSGRNYDAETRGPKLGFENLPTEDKDTLEERASTLAIAAREHEERERKEEKPLDLFTLQPKKPNWDLKRDLARKLEVLDQRTDKAIRRLVKERIEAQKRVELGSVNGNAADGEGESVGIAGTDLVEGVKIREREEEELRNREQQEDES